MTTTASNTTSRPSFDRRVVIMGVSGSGKSSVGEAVGANLGVQYVDGDRHHPQANIDKMSNGEPLNDADRAGWLAILTGLIAAYRERDVPLLIGCSALKRQYRDQLRQGDPRLMFLYLDGAFDLIVGRMERREHFFSAEMLNSQFNDLEEPGDDEAIRVAIDADFHDVIKTGTAALEQRIEQDTAP